MSSIAVSLRRSCSSFILPLFLVAMRSSFIPFFDLFYRPLRMLAHHGFGIFAGAVQYRQGVHIPSVAKCDRDVAQIASSLGTFNGTLLEAPVELLR